MLNRRELITCLGISDDRFKDIETRIPIPYVGRALDKSYLFGPETIAACVKYIENESKRGAAPFDANAYTTADSVKAFTDLAGGDKSLVQIAVDQQIDPRHLESIAKKYAEMSGAIVMTRTAIDQLCEKLSRELAEVRELRGDSLEDDVPLEVKTLEDLSGVLVALVRRKVCVRCRKARRAEECADCTFRKIERELQKRILEVEAQGGTRAKDAAE
jgi:hypothetical protein